MDELSSRTRVVRGVFGAGIVAGLVAQLVRAWVQPVIGGAKVALTADEYVVGVAAALAAGVCSVGCVLSVMAVTRYGVAATALLVGRADVEARDSVRVVVRWLPTGVIVGALAGEGLRGVLNSGAGWLPLPLLALAIAALPWVLALKLWRQALALRLLAERSVEPGEA